MTAAIISAVVTMAVAGIGFVAAYRNSRRLSERNDRLQRINKQLADLYGPMLTLTGTADIAWRTFMAEHGGDGLAIVDEQGRIRVDKMEWMIWVQEVLMPLNRRLFEKVLQGGDLLIEEQMPDVVLKFMAHTSAWEATLARWKSGNEDVLTAVVNHPGRGLYRYAEAGYQSLKAEQQRLLAAQRVSAGRRV